MQYSGDNIFVVYIFDYFFINIPEMDASLRNLESDQLQLQMLLEVSDGTGDITRHLCMI